MKKLSKSKDDSISKLAEKIIDKWKKIIKKKTDEKIEKSEKKNSYSDNLPPTKVTKLQNIHSFQENLKKITEQLHDFQHIPIRNTVKKLIFDAIRNKEEFECNLFNNC
jgi:formate dehydrogenase maturation protein FdhE